MNMEWQGGGREEEQSAGTGADPRKALSFPRSDPGSGDKKKKRGKKKGKKSSQREVLRMQPKDSAGIGASTLIPTLTSTS